MQPKKSLIPGYELIIVGFPSLNCVSHITSDSLRKKHYKNYCLLSEPTLLKKRFKCKQSLKRVKIEANYKCVHSLFSQVFRPEQQTFGWFARVLQKVMRF